MTAGRLAFVFGALAGVIAVLLAVNLRVSAPVFVAFCVLALLVIVVVLGLWGGHGRPSRRS